MDTCELTQLIGELVIETRETLNFTEVLKEEIKTIKRENLQFRRQHDMILARESAHAQMGLEIDSLKSQLNQQRDINARQAESLSIFEKSKVKTMIEGGVSNK